MRLRTVFRKLLALQDVLVTAVEIRAPALAIFVDVRPRTRRPRCARCGTVGRGSHDAKVRKWRHLDLGPWAVFLRARQRRFPCPKCGTVTEKLPWADVGSAFTCDFEDLTAFFAQQTSKTVVSRVMKIAWPTVGTIVERAVARHGMPLARRRLYHIGIDEISYRKHHKYLTLVADHVTGEIVWGGEGRSGDTVGKFLDDLGPDGASSVELVSMDMSQAYIAKVRERLPNATIVFDPFHVVKLANDAVDQVRRRQVKAVNPENAVAVKRTRWVLLKAPEHLLPQEREKLGALAVANKPLYRAYLLKESLREMYRLSPEHASRRLDGWLAWASRSRLAPFVRLARTIRAHRDGILAAVEHGISNGRLEGLNSKVRLLSHRAFGFHSADALLALVFLCCSGITLELPSDRRPTSDPHTI